MQKYKVGQYVQSKIDVHNGVSMIVRKGEMAQVDGFEDGRLIIRDCIGARCLIDEDKVKPVKDPDALRKKMNDAFMSRMAAELGRKGGSVTSPAKRAASAENGKKGGRPRKAD